MATESQSEQAIRTASGSAANLFVADASVTPGIGQYRETLGANRTVQTTEAVDLEIERTIARLTNLANELAVSDPEMAAELRQAAGDLASKKGSPEARASLAMTSTVEARGHAVAGGTTTVTGSAAQAAVLSGRIPSSQELYNSQYVSQGYVRDGNIEAFLQRYGFEKETIAFAERSNTLYEGTSLHNNAEQIVTQAELTRHDPSYQPFIDKCIDRGDRETALSAQAVAMGGYLDGETISRLSQNGLLDKLKAQALDNPEALELFQKLSDLKEDYKLNPEKYKDKKIALGPSATEAIRQGKEIGDVLEAHHQDVVLKKHGLALSAQYEFSGAEIQSAMEEAEKLHIPTQGRSQSDVFYELSVKGAASNNDVVKKVVKVAARSESNSIIYSSLEHMNAAQKEAFYKERNPERRVAMIEETGIALTDDQKIATRVVVSNMGDKTAIEEAKEAHGRDVQLVKEGKSQDATNLLNFQANRAVESLTGYKSLAAASVAGAEYIKDAGSSLFSYFAGEQGDASRHEAINHSVSAAAEKMKQRPVSIEEAAFVQNVLNSRAEKIDSWANKRLATDKDAMASAYGESAKLRLQAQELAEQQQRVKTIQDRDGVNAVKATETLFTEQAKTLREEAALNLGGNSQTLLAQADVLEKQAFVIAQNANSSAVGNHQDIVNKTLLNTADAVQPLQEQAKKEATEEMKAADTHAAEIANKDAQKAALALAQYKSNPSLYANAKEGTAEHKILVEAREQMIAQETNRRITGDPNKAPTGDQVVGSFAVELEAEAVIDKMINGQGTATVNGGFPPGVKLSEPATVHTIENKAKLDTALQEFYKVSPIASAALALPPISVSEPSPDQAKIDPKPNSRRELAERMIAHFETVLERPITDADDVRMRTPSGVSVTSVATNESSTWQSKSGAVDKVSKEWADTAKSLETEMAAIIEERNKAKQAETVSKAEAETAVKAPTAAADVPESKNEKSVSKEEPKSNIEKAKEEAKAAAPKENKVADAQPAAQGDKPSPTGPIVVAKAADGRAAGPV